MRESKEEVDTVERWCGTVLYVLVMFRHILATNLMYSFHEKVPYVR